MCWLEIGGCGMVILVKLWYQPDEYNGFAFGMSRAHRYAHKIGDIRMFYENDVFLGAVQIYNLINGYQFLPGGYLLPRNT
jgi:hypothetical protein